MTVRVGHAPLMASLAFAAIGCGLQAVDLTPASSDASSARDIIIGDVDAAAIARLQASPSAGETKGLAFIYPIAPSLVVPANVAPLTFEWRSVDKPMPMPMPMMPPGKQKMAAPPMPPGAATATYETIIRSDRIEARLYTRANSVQLPSERWRDLLRDHSGEILHVELRASAGDGTLLKADPIALEVRAALPAGALYTWSTSTQSLKTASLDRTHDAQVPTPDALASNPTRCIGCHAVSRDGRRILAAVGGSDELRSWGLADASAFDEVPNAAADDGNVFGSFDPTASRIAVTAGGRLLILDAESGQTLQASPSPSALQLSYPDWSPDGRSICVVMRGAGPDGDRLANVAVALDGTLGAPQAIELGMSSAPDDSLRFPGYSFDGAYLLFERRRGPDAANGGGLWMVAAAGGSAVELAAANVGGMPGQSAMAPSFLPGDLPDRAWVVFSSSRPVGSFTPAEGQRQLFAAALDLPLTAAGSDPSHAAIWLPFQARTDSYVRAVWAPALSSCSPSPEVCDGADDDCDGSIDEECCTPQPEACADGVDNDCDGAVDEGCGCAFEDQCDNGKDDDCDLKIDEQPCTPAPPTP